MDFPASLTAAQPLQLTSCLCLQAVGYFTIKRGKKLLKLKSQGEFPTLEPSPAVSPLWHIQLVAALYTCSYTFASLSGVY